MNAPGFQSLQQGLRFIGTVIYTPMQGFLAAKCGAEYVAPYVNRIDNLGFDGVQVSKDIHDAIGQFNRDFAGLVGEGRTMADCLQRFTSPGRCPPFRLNA